MKTIVGLKMSITYDDGTVEEKEYTGADMLRINPTQIFTVEDDKSAPDTVEIGSPNWWLNQVSTWPLEKMT